MAHNDLEQFLKDRNEVLLSLDEQRIRAYMQEYDIAVPADPVTFWAGVHKARAWCNQLPEEAREHSRTWLKAHGFKAGEE